MAWSWSRARLIEMLDPLPDALSGPAQKQVTRTTDRVTQAPGAMANLRRCGDSLILTFPGDTLLEGHARAQAAGTRDVEEVE